MQKNMKNETANSRNFVKAIVDGFDLVELRLSYPLADETLYLLSNHCVSVTQRAIRIPFHLRWTHEITVVRPTVLWFEKFIQAQSHHVIAEFSRVEISRDLIVSTFKAAQRIQNLFIASAHIKYCGWRLKVSGNMRYYGMRDDGKVIAAYADMGCKALGRWNGAPCFHVEIRLSGIDKLRQFGLVRPGDALKLDADEAWSRVLRLYPRNLGKSALGHRIGSHPKRISNTAASKRGNKFIAAGTDALGKFVMHDAVLKHGPILCVKVPFLKWVYMHLMRGI